MTTKTKRKEFRVSMPENELLELDKAIDDSGMNRSKFLTTMQELLPLYAAMQAKGLSLQQAIDKIETDHEIKTIVQTVRKGANEEPFEILKQKVMDYNAKCNDPDFRIELTPSLFYKVIGGNVKALKELFETHSEEIAKHNTVMGLGGNEVDSRNNRKLAKRLGSDLYEWVKKTIGYID